MTGVVMALAGGGAPLGYSGSPGSITWGNVYGVGGGATNVVTLSGVTGSMTIAATKTGPAGLYYNLNSGPTTLYAGPFAWPEGQTLVWTLLGVGSGTVTVQNASDGDATLCAFSYVLRSTTPIILGDE